MSEQILLETVEAPDGKTYDVSTVRTVGGGAPVLSFLFFDSTDFEDLLAWPFETMVFAPRSRVGLYHAPYATEEEARAGHAQVVATIQAGSEWAGGVKGCSGTPSITPEQWKTWQAALK